MSNFGSFEVAVAGYEECDVVCGLFRLFLELERPTFFELKRGLSLRVMAQAGSSFPGKNPGLDNLLGQGGPF